MLKRAVNVEGGDGIEEGEGMEVLPDTRLPVFERQEAGVVGLSAVGDVGAEDATVGAMKRGIATDLGDACGDAVAETTRDGVASGKSLILRYPVLLRGGGIFWKLQTIR